MKRAGFLFFLALALLKLDSMVGVTGFFDPAPGIGGVWMAGRIAT